MSSRFTRRPYRDDATDLATLQHLTASAGQAAAPAPWDLHPGDLVWQRYMHEDAPGGWPDWVTIWEEAAEPVAVTICYPRHTEVVPSIHPRVADDRELLAAIVAHGEVAYPGQTPIFVAMEQGPLHAGLRELGFREVDGHVIRLNGRSLDDLPEVPLPAGFTVRPLRGSQEYAERVEVHREAFAPSRVTLPAYERLRTVPGYDPELDLVCVTPDGAFASFAIAWYDPARRTGLFEPVGARAAWRGRGLTKAVLAEGMRRLRQRGATWVYVGSEEDNPAACALYASVGCEVQARWIALKR